MNLIETATAATFDTLVLHADGPVAVEFMSYGCVHCRAIEPIVQEVARSIADRERVLRVNVAVEGDLAAAYRVRVTPTFVMFLGGNEVGRAEGPQPQVASVTAAVTNPFALAAVR